MQDDLLDLLLRDGASRTDQALERADGREQDAGAPQPVFGFGDQHPSIVSVHSALDEVVTQRIIVGGRVGTEAQVGADLGRMVVACLGAGGVIGQRGGIDFELKTDKMDNSVGDPFKARQHTIEEADQRQEQGEAQPIVRAATSAYLSNVIRREQKRAAQGFGSPKLVQGPKPTRFDLGRHLGILIWGKEGGLGWIVGHPFTF